MASSTPLAAPSGHPNTAVHGMPAWEVSLAKYLSVPESPEKDFNVCRDRWSPGTCDWITVQNVFSEWIEDSRQQPRVLWVHGDPATGKSTLSSFIINHIAQRGQPCHYFFVRFSDQKKRGPSMILRSLACQLAQSIPAFADKLRQFETAGRDLKMLDTRTIWQWIYKETLFRLDVGEPICCVIDGLDESDNPCSLIKLFSDLSSTTIPLRLLLVSHKTQEFSVAFDKLAQHVQLNVIRADGNYDDFRSYIKHEMDIAGDELGRGKITDRILESAAGNFLWVHLVIQRIKGCHTELAVEETLNDLPSDRGLEALYRRMATSVQTQSNENNLRLEEAILGWVSCALRALSVAELGDALASIGIPDFQGTASALCGGFVVVDAEGEVTMIHETAREYLIGAAQASHTDRPFPIDPGTTHGKLLRGCIRVLAEPTLQVRISQDTPPPLLQYASTTWFIHFFRGISADPDIIGTVVEFLQGPQVLDWIHITAVEKELGTLINASQYLENVVCKLRHMENEYGARSQAIYVLEGWAIDLVNIVGKFGQNLLQNPASIHNLIPPLCPRSSITYLQFGNTETQSLQVSGDTSDTWDDCVGRLSWDSSVATAGILGAGKHIAVLTNVGVADKSNEIIIYDAVTFMEQLRLEHLERIDAIATNRLGDLLVSYGHLTTRVWEMSRGTCIRTVGSPSELSQLGPLTTTFTEDGQTVLIGTRDGSVRSFSIGDDTESWDSRSQRLGEVAPACSALSPDGRMIAYGYHRQPATAWELDSAKQLGQCRIKGSPWGSVSSLVWHPFNVEVFGLAPPGTMFKWSPYDECASVQVRCGLTTAPVKVSQDGSLVANSNGVGTIKVYASSNLALLHEFAYNEMVFDLAFSADSRRLYDVRGWFGSVHANIWEPGALVLRTARSVLLEYESCAWIDTKSLEMASQNTRHNSATAHRVTALAGQPRGSLYCYGTIGGAVLCEVGKENIDQMEPLFELESIQNTAWSGDGRYLAALTLDRKVSIERVSRSSQDGDRWETSHVSDLTIPDYLSTIVQLLFDPAGKHLLAVTGTMLYAVDLSTTAATQAKLGEGIGTKWVCHPTQSNYLLGFEACQMRLLTWKGLQEIGTYLYSRPQIPASPSCAEHRPLAPNHRKVLRRLISHADTSCVLLQVSLQASSAHQLCHYISFEIPELHEGSDGSNDIRELPYTVLPPEVTERIRDLLGLLPDQRLVFLDIDWWVCTWRLPSASVSATGLGSTSERTGSALAESGIGSNIERHYFLPGDWVSADAVEMCTLLADGTLLCPRGGGVTTVQCATMRA